VEGENRGGMITNDFLSNFGCGCGCGGEFATIKQPVNKSVRFTEHLFNLTTCNLSTRNVLDLEYFSVVFLFEIML